MALETGDTEPEAPEEGASSPEPGFLTPENRTLLRNVALDSIRTGLESGHPSCRDSGSFPEELRKAGAVFVTLEIGGSLRGCIGSCQARRPLLEDVAENAYAAAFLDPRFPPLTAAELPDLELHLSILTPPERIEAESREELLGSLRPGVDGLLLEEPPRRSTFLPQVWEMLPEPEDFLEELLAKAGLPRTHWSEDLRVYRYTVVQV